jgi:hypothetical protein
MKTKASRNPIIPILAAALATAIVSSCSAPRTYDRGESVGRTMGVIFGDPKRDAERFGEDFASIFRRAERDAQEFPQALSDFADFFY